MSFFDKVKQMKHRNDCVKHAVCGVDMNFYPLRVHWMFSNRALRIIKPIFAAIETLFESAAKHSKTTSVVENTPLGAQVAVDIEGNALMDKAGAPLIVSPTQEIITNQRDSTNPDLWEMQNAKRRASVDAALEELMSPETLDNLCEMLMDSLRDEFSSPTPEQIAAFKEALTPAMLFDLLRGFWLASAQVMTTEIKGLVERVGGAWKERLGALTSKAAEMTAKVVPDSEQPNTSEPTSEDTSHENGSEPNSKLRPVT